MSERDEHRSEPTALDVVTAEAREHLEPREIDWSRLEARVMASVEEERPPLVTETAQAGTRGARIRQIGAIALAAAAAVALFVRRDRDVTPAPSAVVSAPAPEAVVASALRATEGSGEVRVNSTLATPGYVVHAGDAIAVDGARGVFERAGKVSWLMEADSAHGPARARVKAAADALVLALEHGAIEAQVVPVPAGEAFAVDVATEHNLVRVAVHGTHLRVARSGSRVVVDLTEGVIAIGAPPRTGITVGTTVTAPAHVELDANDLGTLRIDHTPSAVRAAIPLGPKAEAAHASAPPTLPHVSVPAAPSVKAVAVPSAPVANLAPPPTISPREAIAAAVRTCAAERMRPGSVRVTVSSTLHLAVSADGAVESARFAPPLSPEIQACAAQAIYKVKVDEPGTVTIPLEFSY